MIGRASACSGLRAGRGPFTFGRGFGTDPQHGHHRRQSPPAHALQLFPRSGLSLQQEGIGLGLPRARRRAAVMVRCSERAPCAPLCTHPISQWRCPPWMPPSASGRSNGQMRALSLNDFYRLPGDRPDVETALEPGEMIVQVDVPLTGLARRSLFTKVRERASFDFALVSAAVALDLEEGCIREARITLGGVAPKPWRLLGVEGTLARVSALGGAFREALGGLRDDARPVERNAFKLPIARNLVLRSLAELAGRHDSADRRRPRPARRSGESHRRRALYGRIRHGSRTACGFGAEHRRGRTCPRSAAADAESVPGVVAVLTHLDAPRIRSGPYRTWLQDATVHHAGQPVALVLAETERAARQAAAR